MHAPVGLGQAGFEVELRLDNRVGLCGERQYLVRTNESSPDCSPIETAEDAFS